MADNLMQQVTGFMPEMQDITRQREMAKLLMQQSQQPLQGQMIGNRYVGASPWQGIANLYSSYKSGQLAKEADTKQAQLAELIRKGTAEDMLKYNELRYGSQGTPDVIPQGQTLRDDQGNLTYGTQQGIAPVAGNASEAYKFALQSRFPQVSGMATEMLKPQKLGEGERIVTFNPTTGKEEVVMQGAEKYHAPISVDTGTGTVLLDPRTMKPVAQYGKSSAGHVLETDNGTVLVDTRTGATKPIMIGGQPLTSGKPLTESQSNATAYGMRAAKTSDLLKELENAGTTTPGGIKTFVKGTLGAVPLVGESLADAGGALTNWTASNAQQATDQARRNFVTAVLRKESGASISPTEFANEERKYFPQIGDSKETIKQKQEARDLAVKALEIQAGPGAKQIQSIKANPTTPTIDADSTAKLWLKANPTHPLAKQVENKLKAEGKL